MVTYPYVTIRNVAVISMWCSRVVSTTMLHEVILDVSTWCYTEKTLQWVLLPPIRTSILKR